MSRHTEVNLFLPLQWLVMQPCHNKCWLWFCNGAWVAFLLCPLNLTCPGVVPFHFPVHLFQPFSDVLYLPSAYCVPFHAWENKPPTNAHSSNMIGWYQMLVAKLGWKQELRWYFWSMHQLDLPGMWGAGVILSPTLHDSNTHLWVSLLGVLLS